MPLVLQKVSPSAMLLSLTNGNKNMCIKSTAVYQYCLFKRRLLPDHWKDTVAYLVARDHGWLDEIEKDVVPKPKTRSRNETKQVI